VEAEHLFFCNSYSGVSVSTARKKKGVSVSNRDPVRPMLHLVIVHKLSMPF
jgi:hypothetical protein